MATDYSSTPLHKKLGLKSGLKSDIENAPTELFDLLHGMPEDIDWDDESIELDFLLSFYPDISSFEKKINACINRLSNKGTWWVATIKGQKKSPTRLSGNEVREILRPLGFVDTKVCSINNTWTAVKYLKKRV